MDELEHGLRAARPLSGSRNLPLTGRAKQELADLVLSTPQTPPGREGMAKTSQRLHGVRRRLILVGSALAATAIVAGITLNVLPDPPAVAATPALLATDHVDTSAQRILEDAASSTKLHDRPGNTIRTQTWSLNTEITTDGSIVSSSFEPQRDEITFANDGSVHVRVTAAEPFPGQESDQLPVPGTVLSDETAAPGEYDNPYPVPVPTAPDQIAGYLAEAAGSERLLGTGESIQEVSSVISSNILTRDQESAILTHLSTLDGFETAGQVTDRLGRGGIALRATDRDPGQVEDLLIISPETGAIIATETLYIGHDRTDIATPSVIYYAAWER